jgi:RNA polymerase sigma-70 factor (ECF subfamily)
VTESTVLLGDLIAAAADGDRAALERLYHSTCDTLFGVIRRIVRRQDLAEEALVDAYLRIWREAGDFVPGFMTPIGWMVSLARQSAHDLVKKRPSVLGDTDPFGAQEEAAPAAEQSGRPVSAELKALLACLAKLPGDVRRMMLLAHYDGWTYQELAVEFDASPSTIRTWMLQGIERLRDCTGP